MIARFGGAVALALAVAASFIRPASLLAHPAPFSYLDVHLEADALRGTLVLHDLDLAHDLGVAAETLVDPVVVAGQRAAIQALLAPRLALVADGRTVAWEISAARPVPDRSGVEVAWRGPVDSPIGRLTLRAVLFPYDPAHQTFVNVYEQGTLTRQEVLNAGRPAADFYTRTRQGTFAVFTAFTRSGIHHIAIGPDHILFVIGLLLLGGTVGRLLAIVTAFTLGHSVTLSLATLGLVNPPPHLVEPAIALSIVYVGADNLLVGTKGRDVRPWIALAFGLVHGFGFAGVLREMGLPPRALGMSLFSFNLGVEIGQAVIVLTVATALGALRARNAVLANRIATAGSVVVVLAGAYWFIERSLK